MKLALGTLCLALSIFSLNSFAAVKGCEVVKCGTYVEPADEDGMGLTIKFESTEVSNELAFAWIYTKDGVDTGGGVKLTLKLADDGSFTALRGDKLYASGICDVSSCTYGLYPTVMKGQLLLQTGTFKFTDDSLELSMWAPNANDDGSDFSSKGTLKKQ